MELAAKDPNGRGKTSSSRLTNATDSNEVMAQQSYCIGWVAG